ncbi:MAG: hypothetical protein U5K38_05630 [Woeseiaceae bacterium]|nr:hypothetical protein [Woeseiaceae bacterium]
MTPAASRFAYHSVDGGAEQGSATIVAAGRSPRAWFLTGTDIDSATAGITAAAANGDVFVERYATADGSALPEVSATSSSPPPPPPPPPPPAGGNSGGGGGGTAGWLILLLLAPLRLRKTWSVNACSGR